MVKGSQSTTQSRLRLILVVASIMLAFVAAFVYWESISGDNAKVGVKPEKGQIATDFSVRTPDGEVVLLSDFHGKKILL